MINDVLQECKEEEYPSIIFDAGSSDEEEHNTTNFDLLLGM